MEGNVFFFDEYSNELFDVFEGVDVGQFHGVVLFI